jgi:prenyltransferase/squalene oxidase-like repeat protein
MRPRDPDISPGNSGGRNAPTSPGRPTPRIERAAFLAAALALAAPIAARAQESLSEQVNKAVDRGVEYLWKAQNPDGSFRGGHEDQKMGQSALALLALHKSGARPNDPRFQKGLSFLRYLPFEKTYSTGILLSLLEGLGNKEDEPWIAKGAEFLLAKVNPNSKIWAYPEGTPDLSNTQYAVLGLHAAVKRGFRVPDRIWLDLLEYLKRSQRPTGGFGYHAGDIPTGSMTLAAIAIGVICFDELEGVPKFENQKRDHEQMLKRAYGWYANRFSVKFNPEGDGDGKNVAFLYYYLYGLERLGIFSRQKLVAGHDWYDEGARFILSQQEANGGWVAPGSDALTDSAFAVLFLRRASTTPSSHVDLGPTLAGSGSEKTAKKAEAPPSVAAPSPNIAFIRSWLIAGPFEFKEDGGLGEDWLGEKAVAPFAGLKSAQKAWQLYESPSDSIDLAKATKGGDHRVAYGFEWVYSIADVDGILWLGSDDGGAAFWNGDRVIYEHVHGVNPPDRFRAPIAIKKGLNRLLIKVENHTGAWSFAARVSGKDGQALPGVAFGTAKHFDPAKIQDSIAVPLAERGYEQVPADAIARSFEEEAATAGHEPALAFDGKRETFWSSEAPKASFPFDLGMEWAQPVELSGMEIDFADARRAAAREGLKVQTWNGAGWQSVDAEFRQRDLATWSATFPTLTTRRIRVLIAKTIGDDPKSARPAIAELRLYRKIR